MVTAPFNPEQKRGWRIDYVGHAPSPQNPTPPPLTDSPHPPQTLRPLPALRGFARLKFADAIPPAPPQILVTHRQHGHEAFLVGGCVRDHQLNRPPKDWDIVTDALPDRILALFPKTHAIGKAFGIITVVPEEGPPVEVATYRADAPYTDGRHPTAVTFSDARTDAQRRDFTINALLDPVGGERDYVGDRRSRRAPHPRHRRSARFQEDHLLLRSCASPYARFCPRPRHPCGYSPRLSTTIGARRIRDELFRLLTESQCRRRPPTAARYRLAPRSLPKSPP